MPPLLHDCANPSKARRRPKPVGTLLILALALGVEGRAPSLAAQQPHQAHRARTGPKLSPSADRGRQQFLQTCSFCHGPDATGGRGPDLVRSTVVAHDKNGDLIGQVIRSGRPEKGMPPQALGRSAIADIAAFLHFRAEEALNSASVAESYPLSRLFTGKAEAGRAYFTGAGGCASCHSPTGDLKGVASKYAPIDLEARMLYPEGVASTVTVTLATGEQVKGELRHLDDFTVALRDASGWYRSFARDDVRIEVADPLAVHRELLEKLTGTELHNVFAYLETLK